MFRSNLLTRALFYRSRNHSRIYAKLGRRNDASSILSSLEYHNWYEHRLDTAMLIILSFSLFQFIYSSFVESVRRAKFLKKKKKYFKLPNLSCTLVGIKRIEFEKKESSIEESNKNRVRRRLSSPLRLYY